MQYKYKLYNIFMPSKNVIREYAPDVIYHIYNRGVAKSDIFIDEQDYAVFLAMFKNALSENEELNTLESIGVRISTQNITEAIDLLAFCLLPNHFHLLVHLHEIDGITKLMKSVSTGYAMYFNSKYERVGHVFQGKFKARPIINDSDLYHITRYIHLNCWDAGQSLDEFKYSSYKYYLGMYSASWVKPARILSLFNDSVEKYASFVSAYQDEWFDRRQLQAEIKNRLEI